jgi:hypothetical protein
MHATTASLPILQISMTAVDNEKTIMIWGGMQQSGLSGTAVTRPNFNMTMNKQTKQQQTNTHTHTHTHTHTQTRG